MSASPLYWRDPFQRELITQVTAHDQSPDEPWVVLADTIMYPEGGGQPSDRGTIDGVLVTHVVKQDGAIVHFLERPVTATTVTVSLDWQRRFDHMQQHTGQHLLTATAAQLFGWETTAFHLGSSVSDIELATPEISEEQRSLLEESVAQRIRDNLEIRTSFSHRDDLPLKARHRGLDESRDEIRLVEIVGVDQATCGGTHLTATGQLETMSLLRTESLRGGTRLFFAAGMRVRQRLTAHELRCTELRRILDAPDDEIVETTAAKLEQIRQLRAQTKCLTQELVDALAEEIAGCSASLVHRHFDIHGPELVKQLSRRLQDEAGHRLVLLTSSTGVFALVSGTDDHDVAHLGAVLAQVLGGRGGGAGRVFQGKASTPAYDQALARLRKQLDSSGAA